MPRNYGRFTTSIWNDEDFTSLDASQQWAYFMLCTQPEISAAGVLPLTLRRWARHAADQAPDPLRVELDILEEAGHVYIDDETEELLIRKFIKWDEGWFNEKRAPVVVAAVRACSSVHIRDIAVDELRRLIPSRAVSQRARDALSPLVSDGVSGFDRERIVVTSGDQIPEPQSSNLNPEGEPLDGDVEPPGEFCPTHPNGTTDPCGACGTAKRMNRAWHERQSQRAEAARAAIRRAIGDCTQCDSKGFAPVGDGMVARCTLHPTRLVEVLEAS